MDTVRWLECSICPAGVLLGRRSVQTVLKEVKAVVTHPLYRKCLAAGVIKAFLSWAHFYSERAEPLVLAD